MSVKPKPWNHKRKRINEENLLQYKDQVQLSERNINIVEKYVEGCTLADLAEQHGITRERVAQIVSTYIRHCLRLQRQGDETCHGKDHI